MKKRKHVLCLLAAAAALTAGAENVWTDVTSSYITDADFAASDGWTLSGVNDFDTSYRVAEVYAGWNTVSTASGSISQKVTLPAGTYKMEGYAFYRYSGPHSPGSDTSYSTGYMFAGDDEVTVYPVGTGEYYNTGVSGTYGYADGTEQAGVAFYTYGYYLNTLEFTVAEESTISIGYRCTHNAGYSWFIAGEVALYKEVDNSEAYAMYAEALETVKAYADDEGSSQAVDGIATEYVNTYGALTSSDTAEDLSAAYEALNAVAATLQALQEDCEEAMAVIAGYEDVLTNSTANDEAYATAYKEAIAGATAIVDTATDADSMTEALDDLESARQTYALNAYPNSGYTFDMTFLITTPDCSSTTGWTTTGTVGTNSDQHWSGETDTYLEPCSWSSTGWDCAISQQMTLPNGSYTLKAAGRSSTNATLKLVANDNTATYKAVGDTGGTIATDGTEWASVAAGLAAGKTFANSNVGRGWSYQSIDVDVAQRTLTIGATASTSAQYQWSSIDDYTLTLTGLLNAEALNNALAEAVEALETALQEDTVGATLLANANNAIAQVETTDTTDTNALNALLDNILDITEAVTALAPYHTLTAEYQEALDNSAERENGAKEAFQSVLDVATATLADATTADAMDGIADALVEAYQTYALNALPDEGYSFDLTFLVTNNSFEEGDDTGWSIGTGDDVGVMLNSNSVYTTDGCDGSYLFNTWANSDSYASNSQKQFVRQVLYGLPAGEYRLTALAASNNGTSVVDLFANECATSFVPEEKRTFEEHEVTFYVTPYRNATTIGMRSASWFKADNFQLAYYGESEAYDDFSNGTPVVLESQDGSYTDGWTYTENGEHTHGGFPLYSHTSSDESGVETSWLQVWTGSSYVLGDCTTDFTYAEMPEGYYTVSALVRVIDAGGDFNGSAEGLTFFANGEEVEVRSGTLLTKGSYIAQGFYTTATVVTTVTAEEGKTTGPLNVGVTLEDASFNWVAWTDLMVTYYASTSPYIYMGQEQIAVYDSIAARWARVPSTREQWTRNRA